MENTNFKNRKQFRHKAEIPLTIFSVILNFGILVLFVWCILMIPENQEFKKFVVGFFGISNEFAENLVQVGVDAFGIILLIWFVLIISEYIKYYGKTASFEVEISKKQFKEVNQILTDLVKKIGLKSMPVLYFYTAGKQAFEVANVQFRTPLVIRLNSNIAKAYYEMDSFNNALKFIIATELGHIYHKHASAWFILITLIPRMIPIYGHMYQRVLNYSADKLACALIDDDIENAIAMSTVKPKNTTYLNNDILFRDFDDKHKGFSRFCIWYNNLLSNDSPIPYRIEAAKNKKDGRLF